MGLHRKEQIKPKLYKVVITTEEGKSTKYFRDIEPAARLHVKNKTGGIDSKMFSFRGNSWQVSDANSDTLSNFK